MSHSKSPKKEVIQYLYHMDSFFKGKPKPETIGFLPSRKWGGPVKIFPPIFHGNQPTRFGIIPPFHGTLW